MKAIFKNKKYTHFDEKKKYKKYVGRIRDKEWVATHGFFPFLHFQIKFIKYVKNENGEKCKKTKIRDIFSSAHIDRFIFQYYAKLLNDTYNKYAKRCGINKVAVAYRTNFKGKSNIDFAKEVFEFIVKSKSAYVYVGDFSHFFDNLEHEFLKSKLKQVIGCTELDAANYAIFKNITRYAYIEQADIKNNFPSKYKSRKQLTKFFDTEEFRSVKKDFLKKYTKNYGIPQGSSISAVYANVYMVDFDEAINSYVTGRNGLYRRYCDDIVIVIPMDNISQEFIVKFKNDIANIRQSTPNLILNDEKTESFYFSSNGVEAIGNNKKCIDYLGFSFDGYNVRIREKSTFKFYCRAYKKIRSIKDLQDERHFVAAKKGVYETYTHLGAKPKSKHQGNSSTVVSNCHNHTKLKRRHRGNFLTYAYKADRIISSSKIINSIIRRQVRRHWPYIVSRLKKVRE